MNFDSFIICNSQLIVQKDMPKKMRNELMVNHSNRQLFGERQKVVSKDGLLFSEADNKLPEILFVTSYPPRECGIATYSQDLIKALLNKYSNSFKISVCPVETGNEKYSYSDEIKYILDIDKKKIICKIS